VADCCSLPSMSIEQAGVAEMEIMRTWNETNQKIFDEARQSSWVGEDKNDDDSDDEAATNKARAWDDWKDDNPRGAGNKKLTPCG
jgi:immunoglobulin-binding protein 1